MMKKVLLILILQNLAFNSINAQSFNINDLIKLAYSQTKDIDHFLHKKGFDLSSSKTDSISTEAFFTAKVQAKEEGGIPTKNIYISFGDGFRNYSLQTSLSNDYVDGQRALIKSGFFYDESKDVNKDSSMLFQKGNIVILASSRE